MEVVPLEIPEPVWEAMLLAPEREEQIREAWQGVQEAAQCLTAIMDGREAHPGTSAAAENPDTTAAQTPSRGRSAEPKRRVLTNPRGKGRRRLPSPRPLPPPIEAWG